MPRQIAQQKNTEGETAMMFNNTLRRGILAILLMLSGGIEPLGADAAEIDRLRARLVVLGPSARHAILLPPSFPACSRFRRIGSPRTRTSTTFATFSGWATSPTRTPTANGVMPRRRSPNWTAASPTPWPPAITTTRRTAIRSRATRA